MSHSGRKRTGSFRRRLCKSARPARRVGLRQVRRDHTPFRVGQIGLVSGDDAAMLLSSSWRPHGAIQSWFEKLLEITVGAVT